MANLGWGGGGVVEGGGGGGGVMYCGSVIDFYACSFFLVDWGGPIPTRRLLVVYVLNSLKN